MSKFVPRAPGGTSSATGRFSEIRELVDLLQKGYEWYKKTSRWSITVRSDNPMYDLALRWFTEGSAIRSAPKSLEARYVYTTSRADSDLLDSDEVDTRKAGMLKFYYDERRDRKIIVDGHAIIISLSKKSDQVEESGKYRSALPPDTIWFHARSREGQQAVQQVLNKLADEQAKVKPALYLMSNWGSWNRRDDLPARSLESVVLAQGQMERLHADILTFLSQENEYIRRGLPWHRGYLLHGPPGCGKTSIVRALAASVGLNLWYVSLPDLEKDSKLLQMINEVAPRSIVLLEDVDVFHAMRERDDKKNSTVTMAGLLNALDGVATPHGMLLFMTTNNLDVIDPALLRPGRVDLVELVDMPTDDQLLRLWAQFYNLPVPPSETNRVNFTGSTAEAMEVFKQHPSAVDALAAISESAPCLSLNGQRNTSNG